MYLSLKKDCRTGRCGNALQAAFSITRTKAANTRRTRSRNAAAIGVVEPLIGSMGSVGTCLDNAVAGRFLALLDGGRAVILLDSRQALSIKCGPQVGDLAKRLGITTTTDPHPGCRCSGGRVRIIPDCCTHPRGPRVGPHTFWCIPGMAGTEGGMAHSLPLEQA